jgi:hypothetical protein
MNSVQIERPRELTPAPLPEEVGGGARRFRIAVLKRSRAFGPSIISTGFDFIEVTI